MINLGKKVKEKISRQLNEILIERIRKIQTQNTSQLINSPNDRDTNNSFLGGLLLFDGDKNNTPNYERSIDLDKITVNKIYIEPLKYNEYDELEEEEEEEESEGEAKKTKNNKKNGNKDKTKYNFKNDENNSDNINVLINQDFNKYLDLIQKNYRKYENNHFPKLIDKKTIINNNKNKNILLSNKKSQVYETKKGEKIIVNDEVYSTSRAYLKNKDLFHDIPPRYQKNESEFTIDYNLLEEDLTNILIKSQEFINMNSKLSTSMSKVLLYSNYLDKYINGKLEPFNNSINASFQKINRDKQLIPEIKTKMIKNAGIIILKRLKMNNSIKLISKLKVYKNLKNNMNSLELLFSEPKKSQDRYDLINKCKEEIENIKIINNNENNNDHIIELFEKKLSEFKNKNDSYMYGKLSQVLNNYLNNFLIFENNASVDKKEKFEEYEKYGITKFVLEKVCSIDNIYEDILMTLCFSSPKEEKEKICKMCDYYIEGNLMNNIYAQLRGIFTALSEQGMDYILTIFREKLKKNNNDNDNNKNNSEKEKEKDSNKSIDTEKNGKDKDIEKDNNKNDNNNLKKDNETNNENTESSKNENGEESSNIEININDEIFILLCIILSKNKFNETIISFIETILTKVQNGEMTDIALKGDIIKECKEIKTIIQENIKNIIKEQIRKCLHNIALNDDIDIFINNYYIVLELIKDEISKYDEINSDNKNNNKLMKIIIKEQKNYIENWAKINILRFETNRYKSWEVLKEIPQKYQNILNLFFSFDIESNCMKNEIIITKFPLDKLNLIKEALEEEENGNDDSKINNTLLNLKDGDKPELNIKINQTALEIIYFSFEILKMFTLFHKECYGSILGNAAAIIISHINYQTDLIYKGFSDFNVTQSEISMSYSVFLLLQYIYEHIREGEFFVEIAKYSKQKLIDNFLDITKDINNKLDMSKKAIEEMIQNKCLKQSLNILRQIELPNYNMVSGDVPVKEYALSFVSNLKDIYESMINSYEESYIIEMTNKTLEEFFDKFEEFIFHGQKIEEENCLRQFKRDMIFLKKNIGFITIIDLNDVRNRIDNINKSVLPESMLKTKKK